MLKSCSADKRLIKNIEKSFSRNYFELEMSKMKTNKVITVSASAVGINTLPCLSRFDIDFTIDN